jgi:hypothetical protein
VQVGPGDQGDRTAPQGPGGALVTSLAIAATPPVTTQLTVDLVVAPVQPVQESQPASNGTAAAPSEVEVTVQVGPGDQGSDRGTQGSGGELVYSLVIAAASPGARGQTENLVFASAEPGQETGTPEVAPPVRSGVAVNSGALEGAAQVAQVIFPERSTSEAAAEPTASGPTALAAVGSAVAPGGAVASPVGSTVQVEAQAQPGGNSSSASPASPASAGIVARTNDNAPVRSTPTDGLSGNLITLAPGTANAGAGATETARSGARTESDGTPGLAPNLRGNLQSATRAPERWDQVGLIEPEARPPFGGAGEAPEVDALAGAGAGAGAGPVAAAIAIEHLLGWDAASPREIDWLAESLPLNAANLEQAIARCLDQLDAAGGALTDLLVSQRLLPWLQGAVLASAACVVAYQVRRKARSVAIAIAGAEAGAGALGEEEDAEAFPWLLDWRSEES